MAGTFFFPPGMEGTSEISRLIATKCDRSAGESPTYCAYAFYIYRMQCFGVHGRDRLICENEHVHVEPVVFIFDLDHNNASPAAPARPPRV